MKAHILVLALVAMGGAVHGQKLFHEHFEDFIEVILDEAGQEITAIAEQYFQYDAFITTMTFLRTKDFRDLIYEMENLPEFAAVVEFLERDNIDIHFFIDLLNSALEIKKKSIKTELYLDTIGGLKLKRRISRQQVSGTDFNSYVKDVTAAFPKDSLSALYDQKMADDEVFKSAMDNLQSDEWNDLFNALKASDTFQQEIQILADNGFDIDIVFDEFIAIFGQL